MVSKNLIITCHRGGNGCFTGPSDGQRFISLCSTFQIHCRSQIEEYQNEVALAEEKARQLRASQPQVAIDENALTFTQDAAIIEKGKSVFTEYNCGSCHRNDGGGNTIGPNLTDEYWLHGGDIKNVFSTIKNGVVEKGMPAWGKSMKPEAVRDVTFFVMSLQGTNPQNAKAPQGEIFKGTTEKPDSTKVQASL